MPTSHGMEIAFLGSGNAFAPARCWSGFVLDERHMFDAPPTALYSLKRLGISPALIETVFISHFHADHFFGLPFLLLEYEYEARRTADLTLVGPRGLEERLMRLTEIGYPTLLSKDPGYRLQYVEVEHGTAGCVGDLKFEAVEVDHGGTALQAYGYRIECPRGTLSYTGDTRTCESLMHLGRNVDVFVADCTYATGRDRPEHMSLVEVQELRERLAKGTQFVLTHLGDDIELVQVDGMTVAADFQRYRF